MSKTVTAVSQEERPYNKVEIKAQIMDSLEELFNIAVTGDSCRRDLMNPYADSKPIYDQVRIVADRALSLGAKLQDKIEEYNTAPGVKKTIHGPLLAGRKRKDDEESGTGSDSESSEDDGKPTPGGARAARRRVT
jgi:hypothetical protein